MKKSIVILASGGGSNAKSILRHFENDVDVSIAAIISNRAGAGVHDIAAEFGVPSFTFDKLARAEGNLEKKIIDINPDLIVLAGYLLKIPVDLTRRFEGKIVNIHPSLLPKFGGKGMYGMHVHEAVFENEERESGLTIHYVNEAYDEGKIILQLTCTIEDCFSPKDIQTKILAMEHRYYPLAIENLLKRQI